MKKSLLIPLIVFCLNASAVEYDKLTTYGTNSITLLEGDYFEAIGGSMYINSGSIHQARVYANIDNHSFKIGVIEGNSSSSSFAVSKIIGPATISISHPYENSELLKAVLFYKLTRASEVKTVTNSITIPAITNQEWAVTLERSTDLTNWETVAPGTVMGTDSLQFYRLRVGGETTTVESTSTGGE